MKVLITGADGYIGRALARRMAAPGATLQGQAIDQLTLCDLRLPEAPQAPHVRAVSGSIADAAVIEAVTQNRPDVVFHLASVPSGQSESDYELGLTVNVHATLALVEAVRRGGAAPTFVFTSSIAVFGAPLPARIDDDTPLRPSLSYGAQKQMAEIFLADCTRRGFLHARSLRLPGIVARPPRPRARCRPFPASSFVPWWSNGPTSVRCRPLPPCGCCRSRPASTTCCTRRSARPSAWAATPPGPCLRNA